MSNVKKLLLLRTRSMLNLLACVYTFLVYIYIYTHTACNPIKKITWITRENRKLDISIYIYCRSPRICPKF